MNTNNLFDLGQLAEVAYGNFYDTKGLINGDNDIQNILQN